MEEPATPKDSRERASGRKLLLAVAQTMLRSQVLVQGDTGTWTTACGNPTNHGLILRRQYPVCYQLRNPATTAGRDARHEAEGEYDRFKKGVATRCCCGRRT